MRCDKCGQEIVLPHQTRPPSMTDEELREAMKKVISSRYFELPSAHKSIRKWLEGVQKAINKVLEDCEVICDKCGKQSDNTVKHSDGGKIINLCIGCHYEHNEERRKGK